MIEFNVGARVIIKDFQYDIPIYEDREKWADYNGRTGVILYVNDDPTYPYTVRFDDPVEHPCGSRDITVLVKPTEIQPL